LKTKTTYIDISGIPVKLVKKRIRNLNLRVCRRTGEVRVSAPWHTGLHSIRTFVMSKRDWIDKHVQRSKERAPKILYKYVQGECHFIMGCEYRLQVIERDKPPSAEIAGGHILKLFVRPGSDEKKRESVLREWYREILKKQIPALIGKWEKELNVTVKDWGVKQMKTRWGTCNIRDSRIWLNLELAKTPPGCLDYVVLHEMVHLLERYHNKRFYTIVGKYMPDWKEREQILKRSVDYCGL
jgi:predicted metal-dependent hydrolase